MILLASHVKLLKEFALAFVLILMALNSLTSYSQFKKLQDVSHEMLLNNQPYVDSTANAEILYENGNVEFILSGKGLKYKYEVTRRIKIYNQAGYDYATVEIPYYYGESSVNRERIKSIKAKTYYVEGDHVKSEKVKSSDIFEVELTPLVKAKKFTFPKVNDGVILEYSYTEISPNFRDLPSWKFQHPIPTVVSQFETLIPNEYVAYRHVTQGYHPIETKANDVISALAGTSRNVAMIKTSHSASMLEGIEKENHVNNINNYISTVVYELGSYQGVNNSTVTISNTWKDVIEKIKETDGYAKDLNKSSYFKDDLSPIIENLDNNQQKVEAVFEFVKKRLSWNKKYSTRTKKRLKKVYDEGVGNVAEINLMLIAMLRYAEIDATPVLLSTINNGIPIYPTISGLNYVIAKVELENETILLDATNQYTTLNLLPKRTFNWEGIEIIEDTYQKVDLIPKNSSKINFNVSVQLNDDATLSGQCRVYSFEQYALDFRNLFGNSPDTKSIQSLEKRYNINEISNFSQSNLLELNKPYIQTFSFDNSDAFAEEVGGKIYLSPLIFLASDKNPFINKTRTYPVDFTYPKKQTYRIQINIPENFEIDHLPENTSIKMDQDVLSFAYRINKFDDKLIIEVTKDISIVTLLPEFYTYLNQFYRAMLEKENEKIVLVRK